MLCLLTGTRVVTVSVPEFITSAIIKLTHSGKQAAVLKLHTQVSLIHKWVEGSEKKNFLVFGAPTRFPDVPGVKGQR